MTNDDEKSESDSPFELDPPDLGDLNATPTSEKAPAEAAGLNDDIAGLNLDDPAELAALEGQEAVPLALDGGFSSPSEDEAQALDSQQSSDSPDPQEPELSGPDDLAFPQEPEAPSLSSPEPEQLDSNNAPSAPSATQAKQKSQETNPIQKVKEFSEKLPMEKVQVPAAFPFSLLIEGELLPEEKEKLLDILSREDMGIREVDLEPQLQGNRILIPRISEYAGVLLVQALRASRARMRLGPSDSIFKTDETDSTHDPDQPTPPQARTQVHQPEPSFIHPAERVVVTPADQLPQFPQFEVIDTVLASATLQSMAVEAQSTSEYQELLENLQRELKYKAYRKGAVAIVHFEIKLQPLSLATQYRVTLSGAAIRPPQPDALDEINRGLPPETTH